MSYRTALERLREYDQKELGQCHYWDGARYCPISIVCHQLRLVAGRRAVRYLCADHKWIADAIQSAGMSVDDAQRLQLISDRFEGTPEERFAYIVGWLWTEVAKEPPS